MYRLLLCSVLMGTSSRNRSLALSGVQGLPKHDTSILLWENSNWFDFGRITRREIKKARWCSHSPESAMQKHTSCLSYQLSWYNSAYLVKECLLLYWLKLGTASSWYTLVFPCIKDLKQQKLFFRHFINTALLEENNVPCHWQFFRITAVV